MFGRDTVIDRSLHPLHSNYGNFCSLVAINNMAAAVIHDGDAEIEFCDSTRLFISIKRRDVFVCFCSHMARSLYSFFISNVHLSYLLLFYWFSFKFSLEKYKRSKNGIVLCLFFFCSSSTSFSSRFLTTTHFTHTHVHRPAVWRVCVCILCDLCPPAVIHVASRIQCSRPISDPPCIHRRWGQMFP